MCRRIFDQHLRSLIEKGRLPEEQVTRWLQGLAQAEAAAILNVCFIVFTVCGEALRKIPSGRISHVAGEFSTCSAREARSHDRWWNRGGFAATLTLRRAGIDVSLLERARELRELAPGSARRPPPSAAPRNSRRQPSTECHQISRVMVKYAAMGKPRDFA